VTDLDLSESAWQRAVAESARIYPTISFGTAASLATIVVGAVAAVASAGDNTTTQIAYPIIGGALALALTFGVLFAIQLAAAPVRQRNELRDNWVRPESGRPINVELTLRNERRKANTFYRVRANGTFTRTKEDEEGAEEWTNRIVGLLTEHVGPDAAREFIEAPGNLTQFKPRLDAQTRTLDRIIDGITEGSRYR
jgi:hypothetical protein